jgi:hypothetical protein
MGVLKGKLSWSMAAWLFAWLGLAVLPRLRVSLSSVKLFAGLYGSVQLFDVVHARCHR